MLEAEFTDGKRISFGLTANNKLGRGATADVYSVIVDDRRLAAKIYKDDVVPDELKILSMCKSGDPTLLPVYSYAWPIATIRSNDQICGYLMSPFEKGDHFPLNYYFDSTLFYRLKSSEFLSLSNRVEICRSLCCAIADSHSVERHFVDLKPQNILVNWRTNSCVLLDCDGCSLKSDDGRRFPAGHISTDYISPEATRDKLSPAQLGEDQDNYALAVILFQMFNFGQHPFQGTSADIELQSATNDEKAAAGMYPYGISVNSLIGPFAGSTHACMPDELRILFDRTFSGEAGDRVTAREWALFFEKIIAAKRLKPCNRHTTDATHIHFIDGTCPQCLRDLRQTRPKQPNRPVSTSPLPQPVPRPSHSNNGFMLVACAVVILLIFAAIDSDSSRRTNSSSTRQSTTVPQTTVQPVVREAPKTVRNTPPPVIISDPADWSKVPQQDKLEIDRLERVPGRSGSDLIAYLPVAQAISNITNPAIFIAYTSCDPSASEIRKVQQALNNWGFNVGVVDGILGPRTINALMEFQRWRGIVVSGQFDADTLVLLDVEFTALNPRNYKFVSRGVFFPSTFGAYIVFSDINVPLPYCVHVSRR